MSGPKKIGGVFGASYIYSLLIRFGVITADPVGVVDGAEEKHEGSVDNDASG